jgi:hypothetical protein
MKLADFFLEQLERETRATRRTVERVPDGKSTWAPHAKSMQLGYLANLVASMPSWIAMMIDRDFLDLGNFAGGPRASTGAELAALFAKSAADARRALSNATDEHLVGRLLERTSARRAGKLSCTSIERAEAAQL